MPATTATRLLKAATLGSGAGALVAVPQGAALFKAAVADQQLVFGEVYAPGFPDAHGDYMTAEGIREMAYDFMRKSDLHEIDTQHDQAKSGAYIVESFIARDDDPTFIPGSWVIGVKVPDPDLWSRVKKGELNGFSLDGFGIRVPEPLTVQMPDVLQGRTMKSETDGHEHEFWVQYAEDGTFLGGRTSTAPDGHYHSIKRGTVTETVLGHNHRFSFVEGVLNA